MSDRDLDDLELVDDYLATWSQGWAEGRLRPRWSDDLSFTEKDELLEQIRLAHASGVVGVEAVRRVLRRWAGHPRQDHRVTSALRTWIDELAQPRRTDPQPVT